MTWDDRASQAPTTADYAYSAAQQNQDWISRLSARVAELERKAKHQHPQIVADPSPEFPYLVRCSDCWWWHLGGPTAAYAFEAHCTPTDPYV